MDPKSYDIVVFTDGAARGNPGPGGFGAIIIMPKIQDSESKTQEVEELGGREEHTTNNRMELTAAIEGLRGLTSNRRGRTSKTVVYTDSSYLINGITKWIHGWQKIIGRPKRNKMWKIETFGRNYLRQARTKIYSGNK